MATQGSDHVQRTWEDNAQEFGALTRQGKDMRLALLVACSVEKRGGAGKPESSDRTITKVGASVFAKTAGTTANRVKRHLAAWNKLAERDLVNPASELKPEDALTYEVSEAAIEAFDEVFDASSSGGRPRASADEVGAGLKKPEFRGKVIESVKKLPPAVRAEIVTSITDKETAKALQETLEGQEASEDISEANFDHTTKERALRPRGPEDKRTPAQILADFEENKRDFDKTQTQHHIRTQLNKLTTATARLRDAIDDGSMAKFYDGNARDNLVRTLEKYSKIYKEMAKDLKDFSIPDAPPEDWSEIDQQGS